VPPLKSPDGRNTSHAYALPGFYDVKLITTTTLGCTDSKTQRIYQLKLHTFDASNQFQYSEYFENNNGDWQALPIATDQSTQTNPPVYLTWPSLTSWGYGSASGKPTAQNHNLFGMDNTKLWVSGLTSSYLINEQSALYAGCFDLTTLTIPMISFYAYSDMQTNDGVVLQFSLDTKNIVDQTKDWKVLGKYVSKTNKATGVNWYNAQSVASLPGGLGNAWTEYKAKSTPDSLAYLNAKHALDTVFNVPGFTPNRAIFRFKLGGGATVNPYNGFAIDNVRIGNRTRTILLENFTTINGGSQTVNNSIKTENTYINNFNSSGVGTKLIKVNYHVGTNGIDQFNLDDPDDQGARALYYNVKNVPYNFLDGERPKDAASDPFTTWGSFAYDLQSLKLARANIQINATSDPTTGKIKVSAQIQSVDTAIHAGAIVQIVILEPIVKAPYLPSNIQTGETVFEFVPRKMLPSAIGTKIDTNLPLNQTLNFGPFEWMPNNIADRQDNDSLAVVVFLQDELSKEVYQTELKHVRFQNIITAIEPLSAEYIKLYPNPADKELTIELPSAVKETTTLRLANQWGQYTELDSFSEGERKKTISTNTLAAGVYILQIGGNESAVRAKVVVVHE
jgi:hypothetical protein